MAYEKKEGKSYPAFEALCLAHGLPTPEREIRFHPKRKWRFDFAWPSLMVALEIEGGAFRGPGHRSVGVFLRNIEKYNEAAIHGWKVLRCTTDDMRTGSVFDWLERVLRGE